MERLNRQISQSKTLPPRQESFFRKKDSTPYFIQPKLTINQPNDPDGYRDEQEADAMADRVMRMTDHEDMDQPFFSPSVSPLQRICADCEEEEKNVQRKEENGKETAANHSLESYVGRLNSGGQSLPDKVRNFYEPRFGYDFSQVKVHTDSVAAKSAQSINALAYTSGNHIVFNQGQYSPESANVKRLLAHELAHVVQHSTPANAFRHVYVQPACLPETECASIAQRGSATQFGKKMETQSATIRQQILREPPAQTKFRYHGTRATKTEPQ